MRKNRRSESGGFNPRLFLACSFFLISGVLALSAFVGSPLSIVNKHDSKAFGPMWSIPLDPNVGYSHWNELIVSATRGIPAIGQPAAGLRSFAMKAAGGRNNPTVSQNKANRSLAPLVSDAVVPASSLPFRNLPSVNPFSTWVEQPEPRTPASRFPSVPRNPHETDPVLQANAPAVGMPSVGASFEGMNISTACGNCLPPDTNGAVGPNHYVQMVNSSVAVYDKTGATLMAPKAINTLWSVTPNSECFTHNNGDPIVLYDQLADRWMVSQFVVQASTENYAQCIAISQTADPTGAYYLYEFDESADTFNDYPHLGVWPDGYYMSTNQFPNSTTGTVAAGAWVFERPKMILGQAARYVFFDETPLAENCAAGNCTYTPFGQLPSTLDGKIPPPNGAPNLFVETDDTNTPDTPPAVSVHDEMRIWKFHVDWSNPANSSFGVGSTAPAAKPGFSGQYAGNAGQPNFVVPIANYLASECQIENGPNDCSPEKVAPPQPAQYLDVLGDRLMHRLVYRNYGDHESLVVNQTVDTSPDPSTGVGRNGVRWYELRSVLTSPVVYQQGTFAPLQDPTNPLWRWMGSVAMDHSGNFAAGYSASGPNQFPSLFYAGRLAGDPLNDLTQGEAVLFAGLGIEANTGLFPFRNRWGDYSAITVDPTDDCTFWYTNEYLAPNLPTDILPVDWHTRIGSFRFPQCVSPTAIQVISAVSRKTHGLAGTFDVDLPLTGTGIECRTGGPSGNHQLVVTFAVPVTFTGVSTSCGSVMSTSTSGDEVTINLTGVPNASRCSVVLNGVTDGPSAPGDARVPVNFLEGDTTANGAVNSSDISQTQSQSGQGVDSGNFREDVTVNGLINSSDISLVQSKSGTALP
ncbi:MAG: large repetitive protein [Blastocatellia bacterium]|nr:large repetitive protein [Blastocatellia bacterium]